MATVCGMAIEIGQEMWHDLHMTDSAGIIRLRDLAGSRRRVQADIDTLTPRLCADGEFVTAIADALGVSRETIRRFRDNHGILDAREIRRAKGASARRHSNSTEEQLQRAAGQK